MFGVHPIAPAFRFDVMGLVPLLKRAEVLALTCETATIRRTSGAILTYRRPGRADAIDFRSADWISHPGANVVAALVEFAEPCAGDGALVRHLEGIGLRCVYAGDICAGQDALALDQYGAADAIITNPREVMHRLIDHFQHIAPTWLLLDSDWASTRQAAPFLSSCSDIVAIGRVKWIEGSKYTGKDNHAWFRFDARHSRGAIFHWRGQGEVIHSQHTGVCEQCHWSYKSQRSTSRFCSQVCRQGAYRKRLTVTNLA